MRAIRITAFADRPLSLAAFAQAVLLPNPILSTLYALKAEVPMGQAMKTTYEKATQVVADVLEFRKEHRVSALSLRWGYS